RGAGSVLEVVGPGVHLALGLVPGDAVALLHTAGELVALAGGDVEVVVGELAPLLLRLALELLPVAFDAIPVHGFLLFSVVSCATGGAGFAVDRVSSGETHLPRSGRHA